MSKDSAGWGLLLGCLLHVCQLVVVPLTIIAVRAIPGASQQLSLIPIAAWGLTQFVYLGPAIWLLVRAGRKNTASGVAIVAGLGILLNGACDALIFGR